MNKILFSILLFFISCQVFSFPVFPDSFSGSLLCDTLSTVYHLPKKFQGKYSCKVEILKIDTSRYIEFRYHLQSAETDTLKQITTDLKKYFPAASQSVANADLKWSVSHNIYIDGLVQSSEFTYGWPYKPCYTSKSDCREVVIYRKRLEDICSPEDVYTTSCVKFLGDSILVNFNDVTKPRDLICKALGKKVVTDSIVLNNLSPRDFTIFHADTHVIYCVKAPCPPLTDLKFIGKAYFSNCPVINNENVFEGSALCKNLSVNLYLPEKLQGNYSYTYKADFVNNSLVIHYYLTQDRTDWLTKINIPVNDLIPMENLMRDFNLINISVIQNIHLNGSLYVIQGYGQPATRCFEYKADCDKITLIRRSLEGICSPLRGYTRTEYKIEEKSVSAIFRDSLVFSQVTCMAVGNYIKTDIIEITNLKKTQYELLVNEIRDIYNFPVISNTNNDSWSTTVDLSNCIITGLNNPEVRNNAFWPNPCTTDLYLKDHQGSIIFTNQLGQMFVVEGDGVFNVSDLPRGIYMITFGKGDLIRMEKVILN
jgi:hypothetical protein